MNRILKVSAVVCCLMTATYMMADTKTQAPQIPAQPISSVALAKKVPVDTGVELSGKLVVKNKKFSLQDSTGTIILVLPKNTPSSINASVGQNVKITGTIKKGFWAKLKISDPFIKVSKIEVAQSASIAADTGLKK